MSVINLVLELKARHRVFYPGQDVFGVAFTELSKTVEGTDLIVKLIGKSQCRFKGRTGAHGRGHDAHTKIFTNEHIIVEHEKNLSRPGEGKSVLEFSFYLPPGIPSSLETPFGNIRYVLSAHIGDSVVSRPITVNDIIDTNLELYNVGSSGDSYENVDCLCFARGQVDIKGNLNRQCYCPGEVILVGTNITNNSTRNTKSIMVKLIQTTQYKTPKRTKSISKVVAILKGPKVKKGHSHVWEGQPFGIPAVVPTISNDAVITVEYDIRIELGVKCCGDLGVKLPLIIGTVPNLQSYGKSINNYGTAEDPKSAPKSNIIGGPASDVSIFGYPDMVTPYYSIPVGLGISNKSFVADGYGECRVTSPPIYTFVMPYDANDVKAEGTEDITDAITMLTGVVKNTDSVDIEITDFSSEVMNGANVADTKAT